MVELSNKDISYFGKITPGLIVDKAIGNRAKQLYEDITSLYSGRIPIMADIAHVKG